MKIAFTVLHGNITDSNRKSVGNNEALNIAELMKHKCIFNSVPGVESPHTFLQIKAGKAFMQDITFIFCFLGTSLEFTFEKDRLLILDVSRW